MFILVSNAPQRGSWVRSNAEQTHQHNVVDETKKLLESRFGPSYTKYVVPISQGCRISDVLKRESLGTVINLCSGNDLDGWAGPSVALELQKAGMAYSGPSYEFMANTIDKEQMLMILEARGVAIKPYKVVVQGQIDKAAVGVTYRPADSQVWDDQLPMYLMEQAVEGRKYDLLVNESECECDRACPEGVRDLAKWAYWCLGGCGPAIVTVDPTTPPRVHDVRCTDVLTEIGRLFGKERAILQLNRLIEKGCNKSAL